jgi:hypothetical protein
MELAGNLSVSISLPVSGQLGCQVIMFKDLAEFMCWPILYCALLRQSRDPVTVPNTLT